MDNYQVVLDVILETIKKASQVVMDIYHGDFAISYKNDKSVVTNADIASEKIIKTSLQEKFPNYAILSEESVDDLSRIYNDYCFIVDPIDGTQDFVKKTNQFSINIALSYKKEIVVGVIAIPYYNKYYYAIKGQGAYKIENGVKSQIHVSNKTCNLTLLASNFFYNENNYFASSSLIKEIKRVGSSYKACLIAEGSAELYIKDDAKTKEWDSAPCEIIVSEAHGIMRDVYGNKKTYNNADVYNKTGFIITNCIENLNRFKKGK